MDKFGLPQQTIDEICKYFSTITQVELVKIYGSRAKGNQKPYSDIDFVIYGNEITETLINKISTELDELPTPYMYDVHWIRDITSEKLLTNINNTAQDFYKKEIG